MHLALAGVAQWIELSGLSSSLGTKGSMVGFPVGAHAWDAGWVPGGGMREAPSLCISYTSMFLSLSSHLSKDK